MKESKITKKVADSFYGFSDSLFGFIVAIFVVGAAITYFVMATIVVTLSTFFKLSHKDYV